MENLNYREINSDIKLIELKLKRIKSQQQYLESTKPIIIHRAKLELWKQEINLLSKEEEKLLIELNKAYTKMGTILQ